MKRFLAIFGHLIALALALFTVGILLTGCDSLPVNNPLLPHVSVSIFVGSSTTGCTQEDKK